MGASSIESRLAEVVRAVLELGPERDPVTIVQADEAAWDSLAHALMVAAVESEFAIEVDPADSMDMTSFAAILSYLRNRLDGSGS